MTQSDKRSGFWEYRLRKHFNCFTNDILEKLELIAVPTPNGSIRAMSVSDEFNELDSSMN